MKQEPWYRRYPELSEELQRVKAEFQENYGRVGVDADTAMDELRREVIARAVQESNWQEGLFLDPHRTRELADLAFSNLADDNISQIEGPHLDMEAIVKSHRAEVVQMKKARASVEEIAAYNLCFVPQLEWTVF